jgi:hypothetical protein
LYRDPDGSIFDLSGRFAAVQSGVQRVEKLDHGDLSDRHVADHGKVVYSPRRRVLTARGGLVVRCVGVVQVEVRQTLEPRPPFVAP